MEKKPLDRKNQQQISKNKMSEQNKIYTYTTKEMFRFLIDTNRLLLIVLMGNNLKKRKRNVMIWNK